MRRSVRCKTQHLLQLEDVDIRGIAVEDLASPRPLLITKPVSSSSLAMESSIRHAGR
jgi:hypothetical protein